MRYLENTLQELELNYWGDISPDSSTLIKTCYELRKKKLKDFSVEDLRIMIGQKLSLEHLIPIAIHFLKEHPFVEGDYYEGDLLKSVLMCPREFWKKHPQYIAEMKSIVSMVKEKIHSYDLLEEIEKSILKLIEEYEKEWQSIKL